MVKLRAISQLLRGSKAASVKGTFRLLHLLIISGLLLAMAGSTLALAQGENEPSGFDDVHLWVFPEYDDPRLLVMLQGEIVGVQAPATVRFLVPATAQMYSAGSMDAQGNYSGGPPDREPSEIAGWDEISYEVTTNIFRVEYYDPIIFGLPDKTISYEFRWLFPISTLHVEVQEPRQSSNFSVSPEGSVSSDEQGFVNHTYTYDNLDNEMLISYGITYTRSNTLPSLSIPVDDLSSTLPIMTIVIILVVIVGAGLFWIMKSKPKTRAERKRAAHSKALRGLKGGKQVGGFYCSQCGRPLDSSSKFCQNCGAKTGIKT
jgi:hypothetical protein